MATRPSDIPLIIEALFNSRHSDSLKNIKEPLTDPSWDQQFPIEASLDLTDCLESTFSREQLDAANSIFCRRCEGHVQAFRRVGIAKLPEVLILHLKRFRHGQGIREKDRRKVAFPLKNLNMGPYLHPRTGAAVLYDLYSVSYHYGDLSSGHYTAASRLPSGEWFSFNDSMVRLLKPEDVVEDAAYLLFYQLRQP
jgi:ubiquitin C-terminal hydrolase